jgi:hypothetical protein
MTAEFTAVGFTTSYPIMSSYLLAFITIDALRILCIFKEFQARIIVRELLFKIYYAVSIHIFSPLSLYTYSITHKIPVVKGYLPNIILYFKHAWGNKILCLVSMDGKPQWRKLKAKDGKIIYKDKIYPLNVEDVVLHGKTPTIDISRYFKENK